MAKYKKSDFRPSSEWIATLPEDVQQRAQEGAARILEEMHLSNVRKALTVTQSDLAEKTGIKQGEISRIENAVTSVQIKTLQRYVAGLGGELRIVADFPNGSRAEIPLRNGKPVKSRAFMVGPPEDTKKSA
nr:helix-turn-helix transcriptional regulator [uncultured Devosia sp.]